MSSLALLEAKTPSELWTTCNNFDDFYQLYLVLVVGDCCSCEGDGKNNNGVHGGSDFKQEVGIHHDILTSRLKVQGDKLL